MSKLQHDYPGQISTEMQMDILLDDDILNRLSRGFYGPREAIKYVASVVQSTNLWLERIRARRT